MPDATNFRPLSIPPADVFQENQTVHAAREQHYAGRHRIIAWLRVVAFGLSAFGIYYLFSRGELQGAFGLLFVAYLVFLLLVRWHNSVGYWREHHRLLGELNRDETARLQGQLASFDPGLRYLEATHPYAADLDVFGAHSLFQLLNRATSRLGRDWLAGWLLAPSPAVAVRERQAAVAELVPDLAWQQEWQARARHFPRQEADPRQFTTWLQQPDFFAGKGWLKILLFVLPPLAVTAVVLWLTGNGAAPLLVAVLVLGALNARFQKARAEYFEQSMAMRDALRAYHDQLALFETRTWQAPLLTRLLRGLHASENGAPASQLIGQLSRIVGLFSMRQSPAVAVLANNLLLWDFFCMWRLEGWKQRLGGKLDAMLEIGAELEALVSLAGFQFANPSYAVPKISTAALEFTAHGLGHPLIFASERISNDFSTVGMGHTAVVTGSNMSGKSTFLRSVGLNMVLALAGGPVCANQLSVSPAQVYTAMRTQDNLAESTSSFYAELKRLRLLLEISATGEPVFYMLDEILKGTNSGDRHRGARALVRQLHQRNASGLVSTHDLELADLANELPDFVVNYSFNSTIEGDEIRFDYHLTPGVCRSFNASKLMQLMGIDLDNS
ncbi:MutS-related protein [Hymenobacter sp. GOD-10R]|uniref:MutS-related protein n=1 Tax=Hymenobacter sp. GOD-10R TaxID=3093922 RepID=UPI002D78B249|nr:DNA mismatch repair protein MutS [Hymenobacter sp. GOD-10R]WRQ29480.1 DNA mismatch repair protein MutS [Hymenobacter sp. GOD-10R]